MKIDYRKDLKHNYMVISECEGLHAEPYCVHMLEQQDIEGVLSFEQRCMDNQTFYYYEITGKQSIQSLYDRMAWRYDKIKLLLWSILRILESSYEYLLPEDDYLLTPETIFLETGSGKPYLCYLPGYGKSKDGRIGGLLEFLMNKVDYGDKEAVWLVYQMYAVSREEGFTLWRLQEYLEKQPQTEKKARPALANDREETVQREPGRRKQWKQKVQKEKKSQKEQKLQQEQGLWKEQKLQQEQLQLPPDIPVMMERVESEVEVQAYPFSAYAYTALCACVGLLLFLAGFAGKIFYNPYDKEPEYGRLFGAVLIILCGESYLLHRIWDRKNRITRIVPKKEYIDPRLGYTKQRTTVSSARESAGRPVPMPEQEYEQGNAEKNEEEYNPTCLLNGNVEHVDNKKSGLMLKSPDEAQYPSIVIKEFPFFIGKLKKNVDYCIEKEGISRFHAKLTKEQDRYYITDLNSTNGTFVNGVALQTYARQEIKFGDDITLADISYQFMEGGYNPL